MNLTRRQLLGSALGGTGFVGAGKAIDNVFLGYGTVSGTNLHQQDLDPLVSESLHPSGEHIATVDDYRITHEDGLVSVSSTVDDNEIATVDPANDDPADARAIDDELELSSAPLEQLVADLGALEDGSVEFVYSSYPEFFETVADGESRPHTVSALRGFRTADPDVVEEFTGADPREPEAVIEGLVEGFRTQTSYDVTRYVAGSVEDNVLFGRRDLRQHFESETDFEAMLAGEDTGLFCNELVRRSVEALQSVPPTEQATPVLGGYVNDQRHKHIYTVVASVIRTRESTGDDTERSTADADRGDLVVPVTFVDYTHTTLDDDLRLRWLLGERLDAYDDRHRATFIAWYR